MQRRMVLVVLCLMVVAVPTCRKASESSAEKAAERAVERATGNKADVNISGESVKITGKEDGKEFSYEVSGKGGAALPKGFPDDLPRYPGAEVLSTMSQGEAMSVVTFQTTDAVDRVYKFYGDKLRDSGWEIVSEVSVQQMRMMSGEKADREVTITIAGDNGKCTITMVYSDGKD